MHYFPIPKAILVRNRTPGPGEKPMELVSFITYANVVWLNDARWQTPKRNMVALIQVVPELDKPEGEMACLEDAGWSILKHIIDEPAMGERGPILLRPLVQIQVGPTFEGAVLNASTQDPREVLATTAAVGAESLS
jgi:hypothetical protein